MGMLSNVVVLMFVLSFALYMGTPDHSSTVFYGLVTQSGNLEAQVLILFSISVFVGAAAGLFGIAPSYAIFTGIGTFMVGFFTIPAGVLLSAEIPADVKTLIVGIFGILMLFALIDWFKGVGDL